MEKKLDINYKRMLWVVLNKSWRQNPIKQQLYGHLPPFMKTIQVRRTRHVGHCWRSKDELISDILLWTPSHGRAKVGWPARTYIQQLRADRVCRLENLLGAIDDRDGWQVRVREIRASLTKRYISTKCLDGLSRLLLTNDDWSKGRKKFHNTKDKMLTTSQGNYDGHRLRRSSWTSR